MRIAATGVVGATRVDPSPNRDTQTDGFLEQPVVMLRGQAYHGRVRFRLTANFEGLTIPNGVLTTGAFGEGFFDKRHPHTYAHELLVTGMLPVHRRVRMSVTAGKGFVAFGTDDPMNRPALRFPVNHHFSQIVERAIAIAAIQVGPVVAEATLFNGDEPEDPSQWPRLARFADSWAVRLTAQPVPVVEAQGSYARVVSPEHRSGAGPTQHKASASLRWTPIIGGGDGYLLAEWARTSDAGGFFVYTSFLAEAQYRSGRHRPYYRLERTDRPEEERLLDPFRSVRPHLDDNILGITRWTIHTVGYGFTVGVWRRVGIEWLIELAHGRAGRRGGGVFVPRDVYGSDVIVALTAGIRLRYGAAHRMGRYGVLTADAH